MASSAQREQSIDLLLHTALRLFAEKGYDKTSIRNIASAADVSLGLLYNYFRSKEELLLEIFRRGNADIFASFNAEGLEKENRIERHIRQTVKLLKEKRDFWRLLHSLRLQNQVVQQLLQEINTQVQSIEARIKANLVEAGFPFPDLEAKLLFASIDGMANHFLLQESYPIDDVATLLIMKYKAVNT